MLSASAVLPAPAIDLVPGVESQQADAECEQPFQVSGSYLDTSAKANTTEGTFTGTSAQWGAFTGDYWHKKRENLTLADGRATLNFEGGSVTLDYVVRLVPGTTNRFEGTYVITKGTGIFKGATGGGTMVVEQSSIPHEGTFSLDGTLCA